MAGDVLPAAAVEAGAAGLPTAAAQAMAEATTAALPTTPEASEDHITTMGCTSTIVTEKSAESMTSAARKKAKHITLFRRSCGLPYSCAAAAAAL